MGRAVQRSLFCRYLKVCQLVDLEGQDSANLLRRGWKFCGHCLFDALGDLIAASIGSSRLLTNAKTHNFPPFDRILGSPPAEHRNLRLSALLWYQPAPFGTHAICRAPESSPQRI